MVTRQDKEQVVAKIKERAQNTSVALVADFSGMSMEQLKECRNSLSGIAECVVVKNTLAKIALKGADIELVSEYFNGPSLLVLGKDDPAQAIKKFNTYRKGVEPLLVVKGGAFPNDGQLYDAKSLEAIGNLPPKEVLLAQIAGALTATPASIASNINQIIGSIGELAVKVAEKNN